MSEFNDGDETYVKEVKDYVELNGVSNIGEFLKSKLDGWRDVEINIAVTGDSGAGKSSFINAIRGIDDIHPMAAAVKVEECPTEPTCYDHPTNPKIKFWDLPGIGTPTQFDLEAYCKNVQLEKYDTYLVLGETRFTYYNWKLAEKIRSIGKKFFFIRTKIDQDVTNDRRSKKHLFNEDSTLDIVRKNCLKNLIEIGLPSNEKVEIFLISNHYPAKWDFDKLTQAILDVLPTRQRECLILCIDATSREILKRKVELLKRRIRMVAVASATNAWVLDPFTFIAADFKQIKDEINLCRSKLGLPEEGSHKFSLLSINTQNQIEALSTTLSSVAQIERLVKMYASRVDEKEAADEAARSIPFIKLAVASAISFCATYYFMKCWFEKMETLALEVLQEALENV